MIRRPRSNHLLPLGVLVAAVLMGAAEPQALGISSDSGPERVSIGDEGQQSAGETGQGELSDSARYVAFASTANNLVPGDVSRHDVFVRDRDQGSTTRVSVSSAGDPANRHSQLGDISGDGRFVLFLTRASNVVPHDTNGATDLFLRDTLARTTRRVSLNSRGRQANGGTGEGAISGNGKWVAFVSEATNLVRATTVADRPQAYLRNLKTGRTSLMSRNRQGRAANAPVYGISVSASGRYVVFESAASNLGERAGDNPRSKIFVRDRFGAGNPRLVSLNPHGQLMRRDSQFPDISADGSVVAWAAGRFDRAGPRYTIYAWDRDTQSSEVISVSQSGADSYNRSLGRVSVSGDGRLVMFTSNDNLGGNEAGQPDLFDPDWDVFIRDRAQGTTTLVTQPQVNDPLWTPVSIGEEITPTGDWALFISDEDSLVEGDTNRAFDLFVQHLHPND